MSIQLIFDKGTNNNGESVVSSINAWLRCLRSKDTAPNSKYAKVNAGGWLHYPALPTLKGQDTDTLLKVVFSGCSEVLTGAGGWVLTNPSGRHSGAILNHLRDSLCHCLRVPGSGGSY
uniref:Uncharacterized protein n=1 Tax=Ursus americanus TaxID=9643 RepID=A0A452RYT5_URSAM